MEQGMTYDLTIEISESNTNGCPMDTGTVLIIDALSGKENEPIILPISKGIVDYQVIAGDPNFAGDNKKLLTITARSIEDINFASDATTYSVIIEGAKAREATFTTVSPQVPFMILRDPPGDASYAYLEESRTTELAMRISTLLGGGVNLWQKTKLGSDVSFSTPFVSFGSKVWGEVGTSTTVSASNTNTSEVKLQFSNGSRYETSRDDNPDIMGAGGDLYIGAAMSLRYAKADVLTFDETSCSALETVELIMGASDLQTKFVYTEFNIKNSIIPSLISLRDIETDLVQKDYYQDQIDVWNQTLARNEELKTIGLPNTAFPTGLGSATQTISWSGQTSQEYSATSSSSSSLEIEFNLEIDREISAELGYEVAGSGQSGGALVRMRMELGTSLYGASLQSRTSGFVLSDDDPLDRFETSILRCPVYNTPIFRNDAAITSCPNEPGTSPIDGPVLEALNPVVNNVAPGSPETGWPAAGFTFRITNLSQDEKKRSYYVDIIDSSNPHGAKINTPLPILFEDMDYDESRDRFISISREGADPAIFSYEGLKFIAYPADCDDKGQYATSVASISAYFNSSCSGVSMMEPQEGWITNIASDFKRRIHIKDYNESQLSTITVQYTKAGLDSWRTGVGPLAPGELNDNGTNGTFVDWELDNIEDGTYDLRMKVTCNAGTTYTPRVRGIVDRQPAKVLGIPYPIDDIYDPQANDQIKVEMTEAVSCADAIMTLTDLETGEQITAEMSCDMNGNVIQVIPEALLELRAPSVYRVSIKGLKDMADNASEDVNWVFIVGDYIYDPDCSPVEISNNNANQNAISQSVYYATEIITNGKVARGTTVSYVVEDNAQLMEGFEVSEEGQFEIAIGDCPND
jgi:hypothetical protein